MPRPRAIPKFMGKWEKTCPWCGERIMAGDDLSFSLDDRVVHYACRLLESE